VLHHTKHLAGKSTEPPYDVKVMCWVCDMLVMLYCLYQTWTTPCPSLACKVRANNVAVLSVLHSCSIQWNWCLWLASSV